MYLHSKNGCGFKHAAFCWDDASLELSAVRWEDLCLEHEAVVRGVHGEGWKMGRGKGNSFALAESGLTCAPVKHRIQDSGR
eukprot:1946044-Rhodomonas_salina.2